ncbi:Pyruvate, phosphate dikinase 1, chloroplastic [Triticum urartu]|uniref:pyruvate, phosphate dikinase n=2 Tax=BOP clade TaxID=359160 RepID=M7ZXX2_TRIUA|nr:Pyruvate, phosphate dikinase 1, chloroplastic [Triticum urartu]
MAPAQCARVQRVFHFGKGKSEGNKAMKDLLGGKGANLAEMASIGLSVPPGFTVSTEACEQYQAAGRALPPGLWEETLEGLRWVEEYMGARLGDPARPLLLSVRSGAAVSMPGMMDTVLNLGLNDEVAAGLAAKSGDRFAYDSYRRFLDMFGNVVMDIPHALFEEKLEAMKATKGVDNDTDLTANDLRELVGQYKNVYVEAKGEQFPSDPKRQLQLAVLAVFDSWDSPRANKYRSINQITGLRGTAVNVQCMVFGNMGNTSGTGVLFTRNPSTGEKKLYGEFLVNAQGEDVVAGIRTPEDLDAMRDHMPEAYAELVENCDILESHYKEMMDIEFTVQENRLWMLQCRSGKRTGTGAVKIAVDMVNEALVDRNTAIKMVEPGHLDQLLHPQFANPEAASYKGKVITTGLPASPGAAVGQIVFTAEDAEAWHAQGKSAILVRTETSPEDVGGMHAAAGILTARGGMTSHAAVVARGWGKCCVSGCSSIRVNEIEKVVAIEDKMLYEGDWISLNGSTGEVILGKQPLSPPALSADLETFMSWVDEVRQLKVMANADTPGDALAARKNGAEGIGLCRTEHMFFASDERIKAVRQMIMAPTVELRQKALDRLLPYQRSDFEGIFRAMDGRCRRAERLSQEGDIGVVGGGRGQRDLAVSLAVKRPFLAPWCSPRRWGGCTRHAGVRGTLAASFMRVDDEVVMGAAAGVDANVDEAGVRGTLAASFMRVDDEVVMGAAAGVDANVDERRSWTVGSTAVVAVTGRRPGRTIVRLRVSHSEDAAVHHAAPTGANQLPHLLHPCDEDGSSCTWWQHAGVGFLCGSGSGSQEQEAPFVSSVHGRHRRVLGQHSASLAGCLLAVDARWDRRKPAYQQTRLPVTIRLLDPPLHEFLPEGHVEDIVRELCAETGAAEDDVLARMEKLSEVNPMLGFRGCRLGISYPELTEMQARAIFEAAISMTNQGIQVFPEIMVPLVGTPQELGHQVALIRQIANNVFTNMGKTIDYKVGTMIEIPRAALVADEIAEQAEFFSFGTNDLTQMTFGYSRDDVGKFLPIYLAQGILQHDPFEVLDQRGVGELVKIATERGRKARPNLKVGICGEHGGEPSSVAFFAKAGLDYVSCSPFRVPIARLAAAQVLV